MPKDPSLTIYSPHEVGMVGYKQAQRAAEHSQFGIELDIKGTLPVVKEYVAPLLPWEICAIQAQTSNGKTYFTNWWERKIAEQLKRQKRDEVIIHVSLEESIEAMAFQDYGRLLKVEPSAFARGAYTDWSKMQWAMGKIDSTPIWRLGDSADKSENSPELYLSNAIKAIRALTSGEITGSPVKPAVIIFDYLQAFPIDPEVKQHTDRAGQRRLQVANDVFRLRETTIHLGCPIIVDVQAKQTLEGNNEPYMIPGTYDGMETSAIATRFDRIFSLWMPKTSYLIGQTVFNKEKTPVFTVKEDQVFFKVNKQRGGLPAGRVWELRIDFQEQEYYDAFYKGG